MNRNMYAISQGYISAIYKIIKKKLSKFSQKIESSPVMVTIKTVTVPKEWCRSRGFISYQTNCNHPDTNVWELSQGDSHDRNIYLLLSIPSTFILSKSFGLLTVLNIFDCLYHSIIHSFTIKRHQIFHPHFHCFHHLLYSDHNSLIDLTISTAWILDLSMPWDYHAIVQCHASYFFISICPTFIIFPKDPTTFLTCKTFSCTSPSMFA